MDEDHHDRCDQMAIKAALIPSLVALIVLTVGCVSATVTHHRPTEAADEAKAFAELAFVQNDVPAAMAKLSPNAAELWTASELGQVLDQMHADGRPETIAATEYQRLPGAAAMNIFLEGRSGSQVFYYRLLMEGSSKSGYAVSGLWRGSGAYPNPEERQPIP